MSRRSVCLTAALLASVLYLGAPALVRAQDAVEEGVTYRVVLTNNKEVIGEVREVGDRYEITVGPGIKRTYKKSQVREIKPLEQEAAEKPGSFAARRTVTDAEIEEILGSEAVEDLYVWDYVRKVDLSAPLPVDYESLEVMKRYAGKSAKVLETDHFLVVYTSDTAAARKLVARLEIVYKWNVTFMRLFDIPGKLPDHKFEVFYFGTFKEYTGYQTLNGWMSSGALGFYMRTNNRCAFFDMKTWPPVAQRLRIMRDGNVPFRERRKAENEFERYTNYLNLEVVQHEATHAIHFNVGIFPKGADTGKWMTEGLCVQFEVPPTQEGGSFGSINYSRLDSYHKFYGKNSQRVPWQFVKNLVLAPGSGIHDYVMGWALNYYLRKQRKEEYGGFMRSLSAKEETWSFNSTPTERLAEFEEHFGTLDEEWVKEFFAWIAKIPLKKEAIVEFPDNMP